MRAAKNLTTIFTSIFLALAVSVALAGYAMAKPFVPHQSASPSAAAPQAAGTQYECPMHCKVMNHPGRCPVCGMEMSAITPAPAPKADAPKADEEAKPEAKYACPMGDYRGEDPGKCPVCGMTLQPIGEKAAASTELAGDPYYLSTSPTGKPLGDKPVVYYYQSRQFRFADAADLAAFKSSPAGYIAAVDKQMTADQLPYYPLKTCPVTGEELGGMGQPVNYVYRNRLVRFCCGGCINDFNAHPAKYLKQLDAAAVAAQKPAYPLDHCLVMPDEKIESTDPDQRDIVVAGRLFRLCDSDCCADVRADPAKWLSALAAVKKSKP